jgi:hypothetical protein
VRKNIPGSNLAPWRSPAAAIRGAAPPGPRRPSRGIAGDFETQRRRAGHAVGPDCAQLGSDHVAGRREAVPRFDALAAVPVDVTETHDDGGSVADDEHFTGRTPVIEDRIADGVRGEQKRQGQRRP